MKNSIKRKCWISMPGQGIAGKVQVLTWLLSLLLVCGHTAAEPSSADRQWFDVYGFWTSKDGLSTTLLINNPIAQSQPLDITVLDHRNRLLAERTLVVGPTGSLSVEMSELVRSRNYGYVQISFPGAICMLPVQAVVSGQKSSWSFDFRDGRALRSGTAALRALAPSLGKSSKHDKEYYALTNLGAEKSKGEVLFQEGGKEWGIKWSLKGGETKILKAPKKAVERKKSTLISVVPDEPSAAILAVGYRQRGGGVILPISFQPESARSSGELGGFFAGSDSRLILWNPAPEPRMANVSLYGLGGQVFEESLRLRPRSISEFEVGDLARWPKSESGAVLVKYMGEQRLVGSIFDQKPDPHLSLLKDTEVDTRVAYSLPVRLGSDLSTRLRIFNPIDGKVTVCLFLFFDGEGYTYPLKELGPHQFAEIDLLEARNTALLGELGRTIPADAEIGQFKLVLHTEPDSGIRKRLLGMGIIEDRDQKQLVTFQGCATCPPVLTNLRINPSRIKGFVGATREFDVLATYSDGGRKIVNVTSSSHSFTSPAGVVRVDGDELDFLRPGFATLTARAFDCLEVQITEPGTFGELECECTEWGTLTTQGVIQSKSSILTVHLKAFLPFNWLGADASPFSHCLTRPSSPLPTVLTRDLIYKGDDRSFSSNFNRSSRARLRSTVGVSSRQNQVISAKYIGEIRSYADNALEGDNRITRRDDDGIRLDCDLWHDAKTQSTSSISVSVARINSRTVDVTFSGSSTLPLLISPAIDWSLKVRLEISGDKILWSINGWEDGFPAFEVYIGSRAIYLRKPASQSEAYKLFNGIGDVTVSARGEIR